MQDIKQATKKAGKSLLFSFPIFLGILILIGIVTTFLPKTIYAQIFTGNLFFDPFIGSLAGSFLAGNPLTSYIIGGELLKQGISLIAVTAFLVSWVSVGLVQMPGEAILLGKRFAYTRNACAFVFSILVAIITYSLVILL